MSVDESHGDWGAQWHMSRELTDPVDVLREALATVPGIQAAFIFGSTARGDARPESDVDVFVIGDEIFPRDFGRATSESTWVLRREVNAIRLSPSEFARRLAADSSLTAPVGDRG